MQSVRMMLVRPAAIIMPTTIPDRSCRNWSSGEQVSGEVAVKVEASAKTRGGEEEKCMTGTRREQRSTEGE